MQRFSWDYYPWPKYLNMAKFLYYNRQNMETVGIFKAKGKNHHEELQEK